MSETASSGLHGRHRAARPGHVVPALSVPLGTDFQSGRINIGSAMAGVVGTSERSYDVWGDAVKMHRHEQYGAPGLVMSPPPAPRCTGTATSNHSG
jgi:class 3 adenylate cyclase